MAARREGPPKPFYGMDQAGGSATTANGQSDGGHMKSGAVAGAKFVE